MRVVEKPIQNVKAFILPTGFRLYKAPYGAIELVYGGLGKEEKPVATFLTVSRRQIFEACEKYQLDLLKSKCDALSKGLLAALHDLETSENAWVCDSTDCVGSWKVEHSSIELLRELLE